MFRRRKGFALGLVLIVMIVLIAMSAIIMDLTTNYTSSSQSVIDNEKLMNAAQSGLESGKAWLLEHRSELDFEQRENVDDLSDIRARYDNSGTMTYYTNYIYSDPEITVNVDIYYCNYVPSGSVDPVSEDLPPVYEKFLASGSGGGGTGVGTSGFIDPNRNLLGLGDEGDEVFVIRSKASAEGKSTEIESMVVIAND